jgi:glucose/arabinose dehydrogenase
MRLLIRSFTYILLTTSLLTACGAPAPATPTSAEPTTAPAASTPTQTDAAPAPTDVATATVADAVASVTAEPAVATATAEITVTSAPVSDSTGAMVDTNPRQPIAGGPILHDSRLAIRYVASIPVNSIRLAYDSTQKSLLMLNMEQGLVRIDPATGIKDIVATPAEMLSGATASGLAVAADGTVFVSGNQTIDTTTRAIIRRGTPSGQMTSTNKSYSWTTYTWTTVAKTEPYPRSDTPFDHLFNGIAISPDQKFIVVNSGSRTDHGEVESQNGAFPDLREIPLTARMFKLPINGNDILLQNTEEAVAPYVYAKGFRNSYDPIFAPNGVLFAGDNGPDADLPDELNVITPGRHYGFPWRFGTTDTPQRDPAYDPTNDGYLQPDFTAVQIGAYANDPSYPAAPTTFSDPIANAGPAGVDYRTADGVAHNAAAEGITLSSFTPHRSPLGLVFLDRAFPASWQNTDDGLNAIILSWGAAGGTLPDRGQDMLALELSPTGSTYTMTARELVTGLRNPIDAAAIENRVYVLEFGDKVSLWEFTFQQ